MAEAGSGVPIAWRCVENPEEDADVGLLFLPSTIVKLSDLECPLSSLMPLTDAPACGSGEGLPLASECGSCGVVVLPIGVASRNWGGAGRDVEGRDIVFNCGRSGMLALVFDTGF